jgi:hypothetical protein
MDAHSTGPTDDIGRACGRCGATFRCAMELRDAGRGAHPPPCWCAALPPVAPVPAAGAAARCVCPGCLRELAGGGAGGLPDGG